MSKTTETAQEQEGRSRLGVIVHHFPKDTKVWYLHKLNIWLAPSSSSIAVIQSEGNRWMNHHANSHPSERCQAKSRVEKEEYQGIGSQQEAQQGQGSLEMRGIRADLWWVVSPYPESHPPCSLSHHLNSVRSYSTSSQCWCPRHCEILVLAVFAAVGNKI